MGRDDAKTVPGLQGGTAPARAFADYMRVAVANRPVEQFDTQVQLPEFQVEPDEEQLGQSGDQYYYTDDQGNLVPPTGQDDQRQAYPSQQYQPLDRQPDLRRQDQPGQFDPRRVDPRYGNLPLDRDPKVAWALSHPDAFPVDVATASYRQLVRVPGIGVLTAKRIVAERHKTLIRDLSDLRKLGVQTTRATGFLALRGRKLGAGRWSEQLGFWSAGEDVGAYKRVYDVSPGTFR